MDQSEPINVGVVKRETKLKELWREAKCIMAGVRSSCWRASGGFTFTPPARLDGSSARAPPGVTGGMTDIYGANICDDAGWRGRSGLWMWVWVGGLLCVIS